MISDMITLAWIPAWVSVWNNTRQRARETMKKAALPDNVKISVDVFPAEHVDSVARRQVELRGGSAETEFRVDPGGTYRVMTRLSPDMQYASVRQKLGEEGASFRRPGPPDEHLLFGIRSSVRIPTPPPRHP